MANFVATTKAIFEAFASGNVEFILGQLADDVQWEYGICATEVPWYQNRLGRAGAVEFFQSLAGVEFRTFTAKAFLHDEQSDAVAVLVDSDYVIRATGALVSYVDAILLLRFNADGQLSHFAHRVDLTQAVRGLAVG